MESLLLRTAMSIAVPSVVFLFNGLSSRVGGAILPFFNRPPDNLRAGLDGLCHVTMACAVAFSYHSAILAACFISLSASVIMLLGLFNAAYFVIYTASGYGFIDDDSRDLLLNNMEMFDMFGNFWGPSPRWLRVRLVIAVIVACIMKY